MAQETKSAQNKANTASPNSQKPNAKEKKPFKMPHLLWIMIGLLLLCSLLTYIIPAGQFAVDADGKILGDKFAYMDAQTPVNPLKALLQVLPGLIGSGNVIFVVMVCGAAIQVFLDTKAFDKLMNFCIYKMQGKGEMLLIGVLFCIMVYLGAFGGNDSLVAIVPLGILFARKLKLDSITAIGVSFFATMIGFGTGPTKCMVTQGLMGTPIYGAFLSRFVIMNIFMVVGLLMLLSYVKKIRKNPEKSPMYAEGWRPGNDSTEEELAETKLDWRTIVLLVLFVLQYVIIVVYGLVGDSKETFAVTATVMLIFAVIQGFISGMSAETIGNTFAKGLASMAFVGFVIGMARSVSMVLTMGNVLHTIVYAISLPLLVIPNWLSSVGMMLVIAIINPIIPSATSKAAILIPIIKPIGEVLHMAPEMIVQSFQFGDGFTNMLSPLLGWTVGSLAMAKVSFGKWAKWVLPKVLIFMLLSGIIITGLSMMGWTGAI
ncbi:MAG: YfcC family protein [Ruthenibacterium sp.]